MKYLLVLQFPEERYSDYDWVDHIEEKIEQSLENENFDGHDVGNGEFNLFIFTDNIEETFATVTNVLQEDRYGLENVKIAYRETKGTTFNCLWPKGLDTFKVT